MHPVESMLATKHPCPNCGSIRVHRSRRRGFAERVLSLAGARVKSCHQCGLRFLRYRSIALPVADSVRFLRRLSYLMVAVIGILLVLVAIAWYGKRSADGASEVGQAFSPVSAQDTRFRLSEGNSGTRLYNGVTWIRAACARTAGPSLPTKTKSAPIATKRSAREPSNAATPARS